MSESALPAQGADAVTTAPNPDAAFFAAYPTRQCHLRAAAPGEREPEFRELGDHDPGRRRILVWKVPRGQPMAGTLLTLPFVAFADETIADEDPVLLPLMHDMVLAAGKEYGMEAPRGAGLASIRRR